jgi:hypothetical protein
VANPYPPLPDIIRCKLTWSDGKGKWGSRFFLDSTTSPYAQSDLVYLAGQIASQWGTNLAAKTNAGFSLVQVDCQDLGSMTGAVGTWQGNTSGTGGAGDVPSSTCVDIRHLIADHYRGGHPVLHHPPGTTVNMADNRDWLGTYASSMATSFGALMTALGAINHGSVVNPFHVVPRGWVPGGSTGAVHFALVTGYLAPTKFGTMRRRLST